MLKINCYRLFLFAFLFLNNPSIRLFSSIDFNNTFSTQSGQNSPPYISQQPESTVSVHPLFPIDNTIALQPDNSYFNNSSNTFIPSFMLSEWDSNHNYFSLPITHDSGNFANTNYNIPLPIDDDPIQSNTANSSAHRNNNPTPLKNLKKETSPISTNPYAELTRRIKTERKRKRTKKKKQEQTCPTCQKSFVNKSSFNYHLKTHIPNRPTPFQCNICHKSFAVKSVLKTHIKRHSEKRPFSCDYCPKRFKSNQEKVVHHRTHTGERPYKCNLCHKCFSQQSTLKTHIRSHSK